MRAGVTLGAFNILNCSVNRQIYKLKFDLRPASVVLFGP